MPINKTERIVLKLYGLALYFIWIKINLPRLINTTTINVARAAPIIPLMELNNSLKKQLKMLILLRTRKHKRSTLSL